VQRWCLQGSLVVLSWWGGALLCRVGFSWLGMLCVRGWCERVRGRVAIVRGVVGSVYMLVVGGNVGRCRRVRRWGV